MGAARGGVRVMAALLLAVLVAGCAERPDRVAVGERMPRYAGETLAGETLDLAALRGAVVLVNVWATWCFPCRREMPALQQMHEELAGRGLRIVAVSIDAATGRRDVEEFIAEYGLDFDIVHDPAQQVTRTFQTTGVPETFLVGADGTLLKRWIGRIDPHAAGVRGPVLDALRGVSGRRASDP